jgi:type III secretory pathway component EscV
MEILLSAKGDKIASMLSNIVNMVAGAILGVLFQEIYGLIKKI